MKQPKELIDLKRGFTAGIDAITQHVKDRWDTDKANALQGWRQGMRRLIESYHESAAVLGKTRRNGNGNLDGMDHGRLFGDVIVQNRFLDGMYTAMRDSDKWSDRNFTRARLYANAIQISYYEALGGNISDMLPVHPGEQSECGPNCACHWEIVRLDGRGNYDCTWVMANDKEHCPQCLSRSEQWNPLKIRNWMLETQLSASTTI
jgi:hypothetical protein